MALTTKVRLNTQALAGTLTNTEVAATASIVESKLAFNTTSGHDHDGTNSKLIAVGALSGHWVYNEIPTGTVNGTNTVFTLAATPVVSSGIAASLDIYLNGVHLQPGTSNSHNDYFINGNAVVTTTFTPTSGDLILASYFKP